MHCGTPGRTPPRRPAFVGRLACLVLLLVLALTIGAGPASSYPCGQRQTSANGTGTRTLAGHIAKAEAKQCEPTTAFKRRGNADPISFAFFIGILVAVLLVPIAVPVALSRRENLPPE